MPGFHAADGTHLAYRLLGSGSPLIALPGGPGRNSDYLAGIADDLPRTLVLPDHRGTGASAAPIDPAGYHVDRIVDDVQALRRHLNLPKIDLLAHSSAANVGMRYACREPDRLRSLVLVSPSARAAGIAVPDMREALERRKGEPWFPDAKRAFDAWAASTTIKESLPHRLGAAPFFYGRWDDTARAHATAEDTAVPAAEGFYRDFPDDADQVRAGLGRLDAPALVVIGELDPFPTPATGRALAAVFARAILAVQRGAGHYPWLDDPALFADTVGDFLSTCSVGASPRISDHDH
ncbi:MAG TPA: alpha/beta hydrolase [Streptosporangiaceae bacterium]|jgi:pimeloyl-ACP methyl ester carboxylesterase|nr:alpha/beta hydrolase [Streptosporangiaceae bacterium]